MMVRTGIIVASLGLSGLTGCAVTSENAYPNAASAEQCNAEHERDLRLAQQARVSQQVFSSPLGILASAAGQPAAERRQVERLQICLQRVGAVIPAVQSPSGGLAPLSSSGSISTPAPATTPSFRGPGCVHGGGPMVRGDGYCKGF